MVKIDEALCVGCGMCVAECFSAYLAVLDGQAQVVGERCIACGHCVAVCPSGAVTLSEYATDEIRDYNPEDFRVDSQKLLGFMQFRRTIRQYEDKPVELEKLEQVIEAGRYSPTGGNRQGISYIMVQEQLPALRDLAIDALYQLTNSEAYSKVAYSQTWKRMYDMKEQGQDLLFYNAPVLLLVVDNGAAGDVDGALAASRMELVAGALGLGCCFNGFFLRALASEPKLGIMLGLQEGQRVVITMTIGYPKVDFVRTAPRKGAQVTWL